MTNESQDSCLLDLYGCMTDVVLSFCDFPRDVTLVCEINEVHHRICFRDVVSREPFLAVLEDCWGIQIHDINIEKQQFIEYGRYRVDFWDEDNPIAEVYVNAFEHAGSNSS